MVSGNSPKILCLHSSGLSGAQWTKLGHLLSPEFQVEAPDLLGYGHNAEPYSAPFHFDQDLDFIRRNYQTPSIIVGHSYGGLLALQLALQDKDMVRGLVLFDPIAWGALYSKSDSNPSDFGGEGFLDPQTEGEEWLASFVNFWGEPGAWNRISSRVRESMLLAYPKMREEVESLVHDRTPHSSYSQIEVPTLLMGGRQSPEQQQEVCRILADSISGAELQWLDGGHMSPVAMADDFNQRVLDFLNRAFAA